MYKIMENGPEKDALEAKLREGDLSVLKVIVEGHYNLIFKIGLRYATKKYSLDDLVQEAWLKIIQRLTKLSVGEINIKLNSLCSYICWQANYAMLDFMRKESLILVPKSTQRKHGEKPPKTQRLIKRSDNKNRLMELEFREVLKSICENDFDFAIISLRESGHTDADISIMLQVSETQVWKTRRKLYERLASKI